MKIETFISKYEALLAEEADPKLKDVYGMVLHDARNVMSLIQTKAILEERQRNLIKENSNVERKT